MAQASTKGRGPAAVRPETAGSTASKEPLAILAELEGRWTELSERGLVVPFSMSREWLGLEADFRRVAASLPEDGPFEVLAAILSRQAALLAERAALERTAHPFHRGWRRLPDFEPTVLARRRAFDRRSSSLRVQDRIELETAARGLPAG
jgi:hypothetical protein